MFVPSSAPRPMAVKAGAGSKYLERRVPFEPKEEPGDVMCHRSWILILAPRRNFNFE